MTGNSVKQTQRADGPHWIPLCVETPHSAFGPNEPGTQAPMAGPYPAGTDYSACETKPTEAAGAVRNVPVRAYHGAQPPSAGTTVEGGGASCVATNGTDSAKQSQLSCRTDGGHSPPYHSEADPAKQSQPDGPGQAGNRRRRFETGVRNGIIQASISWTVMIACPPGQGWRNACQIPAG